MDEENSKWWLSVVDIVAVLSESADPRNYWYVLKSRFKKAENKPLTNCKGFKLVAPDGKRRMTDCTIALLDKLNLWGYTIVKSPFARQARISYQASSLGLNS